MCTGILLGLIHQPDIHQLWHSRNLNSEKVAESKVKLALYSLGTAARLAREVFLLFGDQVWSQTQISIQKNV